MTTNVSFEYARPQRQTLPLFLSAWPVRRYFYDPVFIVHSSLHSHRVYMRASGKLSVARRRAARVGSRPFQPALNSRRTAGTSPANRRLRFTTGSSYFYERHFAAEIFSLVPPESGNVRLKIFPGPRAQRRGSHRRRRDGITTGTRNNKTTTR